VTGDKFSKMTHIQINRREAYRMAGLHLKERPRAARVALYTPKLSRKPRTVAMIMNADTAKRLSLHAHLSLALTHGFTRSLEKPQSLRITSWLPSQAWFSLYAVSKEDISSSTSIYRMLRAYCWLSSSRIDMPRLLCLSKFVRHEVT